MRSSTTLTGAGKAPARSTIAKFSASTGVKLPVIDALPPKIGSFKRGAE